MKTLKIVCSGFAWMLAMASAQGASTTYDYFVGGAVPDDSSLGIQNTSTISDPLGLITGTRVELRLSPLGNDGGWIGDMYAYLRHTDSSGTASSILLNRIGRTASNPGGLGDGPVVDVTLTDSPGDTDVHLASSPLGANFSGSFSADGRAVDPDFVLDTSPRLAGLDVFDGMEADGDWTLLVADISGGNQYQLDSWSLTLETSNVPETMNPALIGLVIAALGFFSRKQRRCAGDAKYSA
jgi:hypothetical protein